METHASRSFQTNLNSSNDTGGEILSISLVNCDTVSLIFVHDSSAFERGRHTFHPTRILPERRKSEATVSPSPIIDNWKTVNARSNCIRGFPKRSRLDNKQNLSHGKKWKRRITSRRSIIPSLLVYKSSEFHPSIHPSLPLPIHRLEQSYYRGRVCLSPANTHSFPLLRDINGHIDQMEGTNDRKWEKI